MYEEQEINISHILEISYYHLLNLLGEKTYNFSYKNKKLFEDINAINKQFENKNIDIEEIFTNKEKINIKTLICTNEIYNLQLVKQILISKIKTNV